MANETVIALVAALVLAGLAILFAALWRAGRDQSLQVRHDGESLQALLDSNPASYYGWFHDKSYEGPSPRLASALGLSGPVNRLADIRPAFRDDDYSQLEEALGRLRTTGESFSFRFPSRQGDREFSCQGSAIVAPGGETQAHILWIQTAPAAALELVATDGPKVTPTQLSKILDTLTSPVWRRDETAKSAGGIEPSRTRWARKTCLQRKWKIG
jgi:hypothetical protein